MTDQAIDKLSALFEEAGAAHHDAFAATDGEDPEWPRWYAEHIGSRLAEVLGRAVPTEELARDLEQVDAEQRQSSGTEPWARFYAAWFLDRYGS